MVRPLALDLRVRVIEAIEEGASCREAAERFGVAPSTAIRWNQQRRSRGHVVPARQGGDRRSGRIEAQAARILALLEETPDLTLAELKSALAGEGSHFGIGTLWRFFKRHAITLKKSRPMPPSRTAPTC